MPVWALMLVVLASVPPLTDAQKAQLDTVADDSAVLIGPALDALLENVWDWGDAESPEAGARVPDYQELQERPAEFRGERFLIEGRFAGRARRVELGTQHPVYGDALTEWVLLVRDEPEEVAVVYFPDPDGVLQAPEVGRQVRVVGRFYKVWADSNQAGEPARYLTFVARRPTTLSAVPASNTVPAYVMLLVVVGLGLVYLWVRRLGRVEPRRGRSRSAVRGACDDVMLSDPAEALERLAERHDRQ